MQRLRQFQEGLTAAITGGSDGWGLAAQLAPVRGLAGRMAIYRRNVLGARIEVLCEVYPVCRAVLGESCFRTLARDHAVTNPSRHPDLNHYGSAFRHTLTAALSHTGFEGLAYLPQLAGLEWLWHSAYYAADDPPLDHAAFAAALAHTPEAIALSPSASLGLLQADFPVFSIWADHRRGEAAACYTPRRERIVVWRHGRRPAAMLVDADRQRLLQGIMAGRSLGELAGDGHDLDQLPELLGLGWLAGFDVAPP